MRFFGGEGGGRKVTLYFLKYNLKGNEQAINDYMITKMYRTQRLAKQNEHYKFIEILIAGLVS